jgi:hypothetical protein
LRFVRIGRYAEERMPDRLKSRLDCELLGWGIDSAGRITRCAWVRTDVKDDGCLDWEPDPFYRGDTPVDPTTIRPKFAGNPPGPEYSPVSVREIEAVHRRECSDRWAAYKASQPKPKPATDPLPVIIVRPRKPKPRSFWQRVFGP